LLDAARAVRQAVHGPNRSAVHLLLVTHDALVPVDEAIHVLCSALYEAEQAIPIERRCPECKGNLTGGGDDWCDCPGSDDPADHLYQRRASWSGDYWCAVEGCTSAPVAHKGRPGE
jgi:hypothetical protein